MELKVKRKRALADVRSGDFRTLKDLPDQRDELRALGLQRFHGGQIVATMVRHVDFHVRVSGFMSARSWIG